MSAQDKPVFQALERWEARGLVDPELAERLRAEVVESSEAGARRLSQYVLAGTGAVVVLMAAGIFLDWAWPRMDEAGHTLFLAGAGVALHLWGAHLEGHRRWTPASYLMQTAALGLLMVAALYSKEAWDDLTAGGVAAGVAALVVPLALAPRAIRRSAVMPAVHLAFGLGFLAVFLDRATPLSGDAIVWVLDGVLLVSAALLVSVLRKDPAGRGHPWALNAFVTAVYAGAVLVAFTSLGPMDLEETAIYPLDLWWVLLTGLTLWGIHRAPRGLRQDWFEVQLAYCVLFWIPLGFFTALEAMDGGPWLQLGLVGSVAVAGFVYAARVGVTRVMITSALAFVAALWYWAVEMAGALGAVLALAVAAALLFRISGREEGGEAGS